MNDAGFPGLEFDDLIPEGFDLVVRIGHLPEFEQPDIGVHLISIALPPARPPARASPR